MTFCTFWSNTKPEVLIIPKEYTFAQNLTTFNNAYSLSLSYKRGNFLLFFKGNINGCFSCIWPNFFWSKALAAKVNRSNGKDLSVTEKSIKIYEKVNKNQSNINKKSIKINRNEKVKKTLGVKLDRSSGKYFPSVKNQIN